MEKPCNLKGKRGDKKKWMQIGVKKWWSKGVCEVVFSMYCSRFEVGMGNVTSKSWINTFSQSDLSYKSIWVTSHIWIESSRFGFNITWDRFICQWIQLSSDNQVINILSLVRVDLSHSNSWVNLTLAYIYILDTLLCERLYPCHRQPVKPWWTSLYPLDSKFISLCVKTRKLWYLYG